MSHRQQGHLPLFLNQIAQPSNRRKIQVIRRFVQNQHVRIANQSRCQRDSFPFPAGQRRQWLIFQMFDAQASRHFVRLGQNRPSVRGVHRGGGIGEFVRVGGGVHGCEAVSSHDFVDGGNSPGSSAVCGGAAGRRDGGDSEQCVADADVRGGWWFLLDEGHANVAGAFHGSGVRYVVSCVLVVAGGVGSGISARFGQYPQEGTFAASISSNQTDSTSARQNKRRFIQLIRRPAVKTASQVPDRNGRWTTRCNRCFISRSSGTGTKKGSSQT
mmetsp:Transcript_27568/g.57051  ORF Transcript_27568/g.57051 Transcript_27568/m.57051 type:complete len:271 (-) Transcript_27568:413-1225(-)